MNERIEQLKKTLPGRHSGERVFIIGNGPSTLKQDLSPLRHEVTMMSNQFWHHPNIDFTPTYYFCLDRKGCHSHLQTILEKDPGDVMFLEDIFQDRAPDSFPLKVHRDRKFLGFSLDPLKFVIAGYCVTYMQLQVAAWMGFKEIVLLGIDHTGNKHVVPEKIYHDGKSHYGLMLDVVERFMEYGEEFLRILGVDVMDATLGGKLPQFRKAKYEDVL